jgi:hypothetical protein
MVTITFFGAAEMIPDAVEVSSGTVVTSENAPIKK